MLSKNLPRSLKISEDSCKDLLDLYIFFERSLSLTWILKKTLKIFKHPFSVSPGLCICKAWNPTCARHGTLHVYIMINIIAITWTSGFQKILKVKFNYIVQSNIHTAPLKFFQLVSLEDFSKLLVNINRTVFSQTLEYTCTCWLSLQTG